MSSELYLRKWASKCKVNLKLFTSLIFFILENVMVFDKKRYYGWIWGDMMPRKYIFTPQRVITSLFDVTGKSYTGQVLLITMYSTATICLTTSLFLQNVVN